MDMMIKNSIKNKPQRNKAIFEKEFFFKRAEQIKNLTYDLTFFFEKNKKSYNVITIIQFELTKYFDNDCLIIEFAGKEVFSLRINDLQFSLSNIEQIYFENSFKISKSYLNLGINKRYTIKFETSSDFSNDGTGLFKFKCDDDKEYIYSLMPSNYCHVCFPCFDQPNLKANFTLSIYCPKDWEAVSNENHISCEEFDENTYLWLFKTTEKICTYIFSINVGDYYKLIYKEQFGRFAINFFCRSNLSDYLYKVAYIFYRITMEALPFFEKLFDTPFPFNKYDLIFCPEFNYLGT